MPIQVFQQTITVLATASDTGGVLGAVEVAGPRGAAPPRHVHHREDEAFYILEGEYSVFVGDEAIAGAPGTWVWGPRDVPHGYEVHSALGRHLSLMLPGGFETLFEEIAGLAAPSVDPRNAITRLTAAGARYGLEFLRPPHPPA
jgi:quercetin dioxygenase-like cupin family protein